MKEILSEEAYELYKDLLDWEILDMLYILFIMNGINLFILATREVLENLLKTKIRKRFALSSLCMYICFFLILFNGEYNVLLENRDFEEESKIENITFEIMQIQHEEEMEMSLIKN